MATVKQPRIEVLFKLLYLKSHRRLRHEQHFGRLGKRQLFGHRMKDLEPAIRHDYYLRIEQLLYCQYSITNSTP